MHDRATEGKRGTWRSQEANAALREGSTRESPLERQAGRTDLGLDGENSPASMGRKARPGHGKNIVRSSSWPSALFSKIKIESNGSRTQTRPQHGERNRRSGVSPKTIRPPARQVPARGAITNPESGPARRGNKATGCAGPRVGVRHLLHTRNRRFPPPRRRAPAHSSSSSSFFFRSFFFWKQSFSLCLPPQ